MHTCMLAHTHTCRLRVHRCAECCGAYMGMATARECSWSCTLAIPKCSRLDLPAHVHPMHYAQRGAVPHIPVATMRAASKTANSKGCVLAAPD